MRAIRVDGDALRWEPGAHEASAGPGEVLVEVAAAGVNRADLLQAAGHYPPPPGSSPILGMEVSGRIAAVGDRVTRWAVGDQVCALLSGGGYAERVAVPASHVLPVPDGVDLVAAAALPEAACTVWSNLFMVGGLRHGEVLLVHGGGSGIGTFAVQLAAHAGARVAVTAGSARKLDACRDLGASILVDYSSEDFVTTVREATDGHGADVVLDLVGAAYLARNVDLLAPNGRLVVIGLQGGTRAELDLARLTAKRLALIGTTLRSRPPEEKAAIVASVETHVWPLIAAGDVRPVVDRVLPISTATEAHRVLRDGEAIGKVLLVTDAGERSSDRSD